MTFFQAGSQCQIVLVTLDLDTPASRATHVPWQAHIATHYHWHHDITGHYQMKMI